MGLNINPSVSSIAGNTGTAVGQVTYSQGSNVGIAASANKLTFSVSQQTNLIRSNTPTTGLTWTAANGTTYQTIFDFTGHPLVAGVTYIIEGFIFLNAPNTTPNFRFKVDLKDSSNVNKHKNSTLFFYNLAGTSTDTITMVDTLDGTDSAILSTYTNSNFIYFMGGFEVNSGTNVYFKLSGRQNTATADTTISAYNAICNIHRVG